MISMKKLALAVAVGLFALLGAGFHDGDAAPTAPPYKPNTIVYDGGGGGGAYPLIGAACVENGLWGQCRRQNGNIIDCICAVQILCGIRTLVWIPYPAA